MVQDTYEVGAEADDGGWYGSTFQTAGYGARVGYYSSNYAHAFYRWDNIIIPENAVIISAAVKVYVSSSNGTPNSRVYFADSADPVAPKNATEANAITKTTAYTQHDYLGTPMEWVEIDVKAQIEELFASYDYSRGEAMIALFIGTSIS